MAGFSMLVSAAIQHAIRVGIRHASVSMGKNGIRASVRGKSFAKSLRFKYKGAMAGGPHASISMGKKGTRFSYRNGRNYMSYTPSKTAMAIAGAALGMAVRKARRRRKSTYVRRKSRR